MATMLDKWLDCIERQANGAAFANGSLEELTSAVFRIERERDELERMYGFRVLGFDPEEGVGL